jgi:hypothetical protein
MYLVAQQMDNWAPSLKAVWPTAICIVLNFSFQRNGILDDPCWAAARKLTLYQLSQKGVQMRAGHSSLGAQVHQDEDVKMAADRDRSGKASRFICILTPRDGPWAFGPHGASSRL